MYRIEDVLRVEVVTMFAVYMGMTAAIFTVMHSTNPKPYMDEIFHVPQAQKYCNGTYDSWDPKITTLPGLYLFSSGVLGCCVTCSVFNLRMVNFIFAMGNFYVIYKLVRKIQGYAPSAAAFTAFTLCHFPLLHFFTFFYYTDTGSTFMILLMYLLSLHEYHVTASFIGYVAVLFRQTNIVWVFFAAMVAASDVVFDLIGDVLEGDLPNANLYYVAGAVVREFTSEFLSNITSGGERVQTGLFHAGVRTVVDLIKELFGSLWGYGLVGLGFILFLIFNGGIVVGDKDAHVSVFHLPQLFYFAGFSVFFCGAHVLSITNVRSALQTLRRRIFLVIAALAVSYAGVWFCTHAHPYLLADNRHFTFYIWRKVFMQHQAIKFALVPGYILCLIIMQRALNHMNVAWRAIYFFCVFVSLVPQQLLEFRYFIIPYLIFRLHLISPSFQSTVVEWMVYLTVDIVTLFLYLYKPFYLEGSCETQRFMW